ncbi:MAG: HD domain-containing protein [Humidesulfovibrio sp.]|uniref:HD domain-containing phosphohydrolase n=1 Tax=Humidesulfovibrio sp. TaxID=2910988 RepID=UPI0027F4C9BF|nr:HD domain-containing phosphohydrolase [Humidesulfovibrio sp.]MDQ7834625.1 HD domain-containing protein [Humidesulfovibrio sp.]
MPQTKARVLMVDDDPNLLESLRRQFSATYDVVVAQGGEKAMELMASSEPFAVLVSDLKMPGMDGIEFLSKAAALYPDTVRILLTGFADLKNAMDAVNQGFIFRFLNKPCPPETLGQALADALRQRSLVEAQRENYSLKRFKHLLEGIVQGFSALVEARDPYLAGHQTRVTALTLAIARELGLGADDLDILRIAALLHDIGKVYVPADFLNRPGILREEEFSVIKMHPEVGYGILKNLGEDWPVATIIRQHHERMDGSGYPQGLVGSEIVQGARIIAVADVVDAMCSHRPYRPSLGIEAALRELEMGSGVSYDEPCVQICLRLFRVGGFVFPTAPGAL